MRSVVIQATRTDAAQSAKSAKRATGVTEIGVSSKPDFPFQRRDKKRQPKPMGPPDEMLRGYFYGLVRYRRALFAQVERMDAAREKWLAVQKHPLSDAVDQFDYLERDALRTEIEFFAVCVRGILNMAAAIRTMAARAGKTEILRIVDPAISQFEKEAPLAQFVRDLLAHLDVYVRGEGAFELPTPSFNVRLEENAVVLNIAGHEVSLKDVEGAADRLSTALHAIQEHIHGADGK